MSASIERCYDNKFGIDLKKIHLEVSPGHDKIKSRFFSDPKFNKENLFFSDGLSSQFELITYRGLNYLFGNHSCYPCGAIVEGAHGTNWVKVYVIPTGKEIITSRDIRKSCCVNFDPYRRFVKEIDRRDIQEF